MTSRYGRRVEYADLRHNDGYALRLYGIATVPPAPATPAAPAKTPKPAAKPPAARPSAAGASAGARRP
jgi:hypothetical protein